VWTVKSCYCQVIFLKKRGTLVLYHVLTIGFLLWTVLQAGLPAFLYLTSFRYSSRRSQVSVMPCSMPISMTVLRASGDTYSARLTSFVLPPRSLGAKAFIRKLSSRRPSSTPITSRMPTAIQTRPCRPMNSNVISVATNNECRSGLEPRLLMRFIVAVNLPEENTLGATPANATSFVG